MNCFSHPDKPAVGFCKSCCKGLCADCAATLPNGLACRNKCEDRVTLINQIVDNNQRVIAVANIRMRSAGVFIVLLGLVLCVIGFLPALTSGDKGTLVFGVIGVVFIAYGVFRLMRKSGYYPTAK